MSKTVSMSSRKSGYIMKHGNIYYVYKNINRRRNVEGLEKLEVRIAMHKRQRRMKVFTAVIAVLLLLLMVTGMFFLYNVVRQPLNTEPVDVKIDNITSSAMKVETFYVSAYDTASYHGIDETKELLRTREDYNNYKGGEIEIHTLEYKGDMYETIDCVSSTTNGTTGEIIKLDNATLIQLDLPNKYYKGIDFSSFQPFMSYYKVTNESSPAYKVCYSDNAYTDENGLRRYRTSDDQFTIDGQDDYMIALGTFYKEKGTAGSRYLIETTTGAYTAITGSEKADKDTDELNMFRPHGDGKAGMIEFVVDERCLNKDILSAGTVTKGPVEALQGEIINIYRIE